MHESYPSLRMKIQNICVENKRFAFKKEYYASSLIKNNLTQEERLRLNPTDKNEVKDSYNDNKYLLSYHSKPMLVRSMPNQEAGER